MPAKRQTDAAVQKQLDKVDDQLASDKLKGQRRLEALRKQAQLGDDRDAAALAARRAKHDR